MDSSLDEFMDSHAVKYVVSDFIEGLQHALSRLEENLEKTRAEGLGGAENLALQDMAAAQTLMEMW